MGLADEFSKGMMESLKSIGDQFPSMNKEMLSKAVSPGGSLSNTLGYDDPKEFLGLTPELFQQSMAMRSQIMKDSFGAVKDLTALNDMMTGNSEKRQAMYQAVPQIFSAQMQEGLQGQRFAQDDKQLASQQAFSAQQNALNRKLDEARLAETRAYHQGSLAEQRAARKLRERELMKLEKAMQDDEGIAGSVFPVNTPLYSALERTKKANEKKGNVTDRSAWVQAHLRQQAMGTAYGSFYKTLDYKDALGGYDFIRLTPNGWYGASRSKANPNQWEYSQVPIVPFSYKEIVQGNKKGSQTLVPKYAPAED